MRIWLIAGALGLTGGAAAQTAPVARTAPEQATLRRLGAQVLFWNQAQRDANFPHMERLFPARVVKAGGRARPLRAGPALAVPAAEVDAFVAANNVAGLLVLKDGRIALERYARGLTRDGRWTSFSVAKSFSSTLVGAAIRDGFIRSVDEPVTRYIPELAGSGYDGVTIAQLLTMTSGVRWNEDYTDPRSDVARMLADPTPAGVDPTVAYMRRLPRDTPPGAKWVYKTGETNLIGVLVTRATRKPLATYLSEKIWRPFGMERDAFWSVDVSGQEVAGCCLSVGLRDYGRMGQLVLDGGKGVVPDGWFAEATRAHAALRRPGYGYGYQWWTYPAGRFGAEGIFGQTILIDPATRAVIVIVSAYPKAVDREMDAQFTAFTDKVLTALGPAQPTRSR